MMKAHILLQLQVQLIYCVIAYPFTVNASTTRVQRSQWGSAIHEIPYQNYTVCPIWYNYSSATNACECFPLWMIQCNGVNVSIHSGQMLTYDLQKNQVSATQTNYRHLDGYNVTMAGSILLPSDISELNQYICGPLNRKDHLCSECKSGYGPSMVFTPCTNACYACKDNWYNVILYLLLELVPITVFYLFILVFQIKLTSAPMTCFIFYSQLTVMAFEEKCDDGATQTLFSQVKFTKKGDLRTETKIILTLYGIFNLDFFHKIVTPFCIGSQLKPIHFLFLGYALAFYPFLLIILTWLCVKLHGHNYRLIVFLWKPFHRCFVGLRKSWNTKSNLVDVFSSFFLLSYNKIMYQIVLAINNTEIQTYSLTDGHVSQEFVLGADSSIMANSVKYTIIITVTIILLFAFVIIPTLLLLFYPTLIFQRLLSRLTSNRVRIILNIFVEKFQSSYKNGLNDTKCRRSFSGFYLLLSAIIYVVQTINRSTFKFETWFVRGFTFTVTALLVALSRPYKKIHITIADSAILSYLAILCFLLSSNHRSRFYLQYIHTAIFLPFAIFCLIIAYRMARGICKVHKQWSPLRWSKTSRVNAYDSIISTDQQPLFHSKTNYGTLTLH